MSDPIERQRETSITPSSTTTTTSAHKSSVGDGVLGEVRFNSPGEQQQGRGVGAMGPTTNMAGGPPEDDDLALAKLLQEQERAFLALSGMPDSTALSFEGYTGRRENVPPETTAAASADSQQSSEGHAHDNENEPESDEALAWRMMQEEEQAFQQRMMAMAGIAFPGAITSQSNQSAEIGEASLDSNEMLAPDYVGDEGVPDPDSLSYEQLTALGDIAGKVIVCLSEEQIAALPRVPFREIVASRAQRNSSKLAEVDDDMVSKTGYSIQSTNDCLDGEKEQCTICRIELEEEDEVTLLPCRHVYHPECVAHWLRQKKTCPQCGTEIVL